MAFLIFGGLIALAFGLLFLFFPEGLRKLNRSFSKAFSIEEQLFKLRLGVGISLLLTSVLFFFVVYYLMKRYG